MTDYTIYAVDLTVYDPALSATKTLRYATHGTIYGGNYYEPRIKQPGNFNQNLFSNGTTGGASQMGFGEIILLNNDGGLDDLINYGFDGRALVLRKIIAGVATILMSCSMEQPVPTWNTVPIRIKDRQQLFNVPIQPTKYAGTNTLPTGIDGTADIKGKPIALGYGEFFNATPDCVNTSRLIYRSHESALHDIPAVYDKGVSLARGADYVSQPDMEANTPEPGKYRAWLGGGCFRLGSSPAGQITFDGVEGATAADRTVAQIMKRIALRVISSGEIDNADITALDTANSAVVGIYINSEQNINIALDALANSIGAWYGFDSVGLLNMGRLEAPSGTPIITLTKSNILEIERLATNDQGRGLPAWKINLNYAKNFTIQDAGNLAGSALSGWINSDLPATASWFGVAYGNGVFVAITPTYRGATSPDGITWTQRVLPAKDWSAITYGNGLFVVVALNNGAVATSPDGITWTLGTMPAYGWWTSVTYGDGLFVAVGDYNSGTPNPICATSPDGITWTQRTMPTYGWVSVAYGNGLFVAVGYQHCATSPDGITWTLRTISSENWSSVVYGNGTFIAVAGRSSLSTATAASMNGIDWEYHDLPGSNYWSSVVFGNDKFIAIARSDADISATSMDGLVWNRVYMPVATNWNSATYGGGAFVAVAYGGDTAAVFRMAPSPLRTIYSAKEYRTVTAEDTNILTKHPNAGEMSWNTLLVDMYAAQTEATRQLNLRKVDRDFLQIKLPSSILPADLFGKVIQVKIPRYGYDSGKLFLIVGATYDYELRITTLEVWG